MHREMVDVADKLASFQAITDIENTNLYTDILSAHGWDLEQAISSFTTTNSDYPSTSAAAASAAVGDGENNGRFDKRELEGTGLVADDPPLPGLAWKLVTLPFSVISGTVGLVGGAIGLVIWAAGGALSYSLGMIGLNSDWSSELTRLVQVSTASSEVMEFVDDFDSSYGHRRPDFITEGFMDAL